MLLADYASIFDDGRNPVRHPARRPVDRMHAHGYNLQAYTHRPEIVCMRMHASTRTYAAALSAPSLLPGGPAA